MANNNLKNKNMGNNYGNRDFIYAKDVEKDIPTMYIISKIGTNNILDGEDYVSAKQFVDELHALDAMGKKVINVMINSTGGNVTEGMTIYSAIKKVKAKVDTYCIGVCASIAAVIFEAGRNRFMYDFGLLMIHNPFDSTNGTPEDVLSRFKQSIIKMLNNNNISDDNISKMMDSETWMDADEALKMGFCSDIVYSDSMNTPRIMQNIFAPEKFKELKLLNKSFLNVDNVKKDSIILDNIFNSVNKTILNTNIKINDMSELQIVNEALGLNEMAKASHIVKEIESFKTMINKIKNESGEWKKKFEDAQEENIKNKKDLEKVTNETSDILKEFGSWEAVKTWMNKMKDETKKKELDEMENRNNIVANYLNDAIMQGKIKTEVKNAWEEMFKRDFNGAKSILDSMGVTNKKMPDVANIEAKAKTSLLNDTKKVELPVNVRLYEPLNDYQMKIIENQKISKTGMYFESNKQ